VLPRVTGPVHFMLDAGISTEEETGGN